MPRRDQHRAAPTLHDVARVAGVSIKTVSEVVNRTGRVAAATTQRVEAAIRSVGYQPNLSARRLRTGSTGVIGLAVPELSTSGYFNELSAMVVQVAGERGMTVLIEQTDGTRESELRALVGPRRSVMDGLLLNAVALDADDLAPHLPLPPTVVLGERRLGDGVDHVTFGNEAAARALTEHLLGLGRQRVLLVGGVPAVSASGARRLAGYRDALAAAGVTPDPVLVREVLVWDHRSGYEAVRDARREGVVFDAVLAVNDSLALGALRALHDEGVDVPGDVAVAGLDDVVDGRYSHPRLTTVDPHRDVLADLAVRTLLERIADPSRPGVVHEVEAHLRVRGSTVASADLPS